jgi:hypothetical protein
VRAGELALAGEPKPILGELVRQVTTKVIRHVWAPSWC